MRRCTLKDLSQETGYAISTISNVLNNRESCFASKATREKIHEAARRMGYRADHLARALRSGETRIIGVIGHLFSSEVQLEQFRALQDALREAGYIASFMDMRGDIEQTLTDIRSLHVDAVIVFIDRNEASVAKQLSPEAPTIGIGAENIPGIPTVVIDRAEAMKKAVRYLAEFGHRSIAFVTRKPKYNISKLQGYLEGMKEVGLEDYIKVVPLSEIVGRMPAFVKEHAEDFRKLTAVVTNGDQVAAELIAGFRDIGIRVPEDCSVIGFNDVRIAQGVAPQLTTLRQPREELGQAAVAMLMALLQGKKVRNRRIVPDLVIRDSVCPADAAVEAKRAPAEA
jgi:LacI family repressor for deo operon, udp, cdd, tsx, nupC, and nupG